MEKLKEEFEQLFTKDATEIASIPKRRLAGNPQELWLWILNNFNVKVSQIDNDSVPLDAPVKPANDGSGLAENEKQLLHSLIDTKTAEIEDALYHNNEDEDCIEEDRLKKQLDVLQTLSNKL